MNNKNLIGKYNNRDFKVNTHYRTLDVSTWGYKKKDVLSMLKSTEGILPRYYLPDCKELYYDNYIYKKTKKGYRIGCQFYPNDFLDKVKNALLTMK